MRLDMLNFVEDILPLFLVESRRYMDCTSVLLFMANRRAYEAGCKAIVFCTSYSSRAKWVSPRPALPRSFQGYTCRGCIRLAMVAERLQKLGTLLERYLAARAVYTNVATDVQICDDLVKDLSVVASELLPSYEFPASGAEWIAGERIFSSYYVDSSLAGVLRIIRKLGVPGPGQSARAILEAYEEVEQDLRFVMGRHVLPYAAIRSIAIPPPSLETSFKLGDNCIEFLY